jgi:hypothetical protein
VSGEMSVYIVLAGAFTLMYVMIRKSFRKKTEGWVKWGLGVDCCCFYSKTFTAVSQSISINVLQEVALQKVPIRYSVVKKMNWWGKRKVYAQAVVYGDYKVSKSFEIILENIPVGESYQIEVYNGFNMSFGEFQVR